MSILRLVCFATLVLFAIKSQGQENNNYYLVEFEKFTPPVKEMIRGFENSPATPFMASDIYGNEKFLGDYKGKKVLIWFWSSNDGISISQIKELNDIQATYRDELQIVSFAMEEKVVLIPFRKANPIDFPIIPKSKIFGELAYAADLGLGRLFLVDGQGIVQKVFPRMNFENDAVKTFSFVRDMIKSISR